MRNISILNVTSRQTTISGSAIDGAMSVPDDRRSDMDVFQPLRTGGTGILAGDAAADVPATEITILLQGAQPQGAHLDIRVNGRPLLGVMFDEAKQS